MKKLLDWPPKCSEFCDGYHFMKTLQVPTPQIINACKRCMNIPAPLTPSFLTRARKLWPRKT